ncbi:MAG: DUF5723 family protein [candidate division Zixibacteria bacterium]|nr:DUF5723 family protein [candidate division Zixibacteria bacterium]
MDLGNCQVRQVKNKILRATILLLPLLCGIAPLMAYPIGLASAQAMAMGGAFIGLAKGACAPLYNPANIGLIGYRQTGIDLASIGAEISNNSFSLNDYNRYTGVLLNNEDKAAILDKVPLEGLKISANIEASVLSFSTGSFVLSFAGHVATEINLGKDPLRLFLIGNKFGDTFSLGGMYSEAIAYASAGLSYGTSLYKSGTRQLAIGATVKYIRGFGYEKVTELRGGVNTDADGFNGDGLMLIRTAMGGNGYAVDIGLALRASDSYTAGITLKNIISNIAWNHDTKEYCYQFHFDSLTIDDFDDETNDVSDSHTDNIFGFNSQLPTIMRVGLAKTSGILIWAVDWEQGFRLAAGVSSKPRLSAGVEYRLIRFFPLRAGYSIGGGREPAISGGIGLDFSLFYLDAAISGNNNFNFGAPTGVHFAVSTGLRF